MTAPSIDAATPNLPSLNVLLRWVATPWVRFLERARTKAREDAIKRGPVEILRTVQTDVGGYEVTLTGAVPRELELDFLEYRSPMYLEAMGNGIADEFAAMLTGRNAPEPYDEKTLARICRGSVVSNLVSFDRAADMFVTDFTSVRVDTFDPYYVARFEFSPADTRFAAVGHDGKRYTPESPEWPTVLVHLMAQLTLYPPVGAHNWVHFQFPDVVAAAVFDLRASDSTLIRLLSPHVRFTNRINYQAVWIQKSTNNGPGFLKKLTPWQCMPTTGQGFRDGIMFNTGRHYAQLAEHFRMPQELDVVVPYFAFLKSYFDVVESFVRACDPYIEDDVYARFAALVDKGLPGFTALDRVQALSVFIWQVGVYHISDHLTMMDYAMRHGFARVHGPISRPMSLKNVSLYDRYRTRNFLKVFVNFTPNPKLDQRLENIDAYGFAAGSPLRAAAERFRSDLQALDQRHAAAGTQFLPLNKMIQSICF